ncbi:MAG TPA: alkaline phosphatase family protein [Solirubrobacterales bacterium]|nr:alkaline phosphatase family protein [Solirubrobacterales bacterium]
MPDSSEDQRRGLGRGRKCPECGAPRVLDQRYCLRCGTRLGSLPAAIAAQIGRVKKFATGRIPVIKAPVAAKAAGDEKAGGKKGWPYERSDFMPSPRAAAAAVIGMLALGVAIGSATNELAQSAGLATILFEEPPAAEEEPVAEAPVEPEPEEATEESAPAAPAPIPEEEAVVEEPLPSEPEPPAGPPVNEEIPTGLPEINHVFVIMLGENSYEETFGATSQAPYLSKELPAKGELVPNYYAVAKGELANTIALISGQGPTPETQADCPNYTDVSPGTEDTEGQVEGNGCVYPATTETLPGQLEERKLTWKAYVEGSEDGPAVGQPASCRHPALGGPDPNHQTTTADGYVTWRNPFVYFHSIIDGRACAKADVGLPELTKDLQGEAKEFPAVAYIAPDACHSGAEQPCEEGGLTGPVASEEFLKTIVPEIQESFAYKDGGLIVITSAQARQGGEEPDVSACCLFPVYPNLPPETEEQPTGLVKEKGGGGKVGAVLLSPYIEPGTSTEEYFDHYSLLVSIEEFLGLQRIGYAAEPLVVGFDEEMFSTTG